MTPAQPYRVLYSDKVRDRIRDLRNKAAAAGVLERVGRALLRVEGWLELDPVSWGDPVRYYRHFRLTEFRRVFDDLAIHYGVHDSEPYVWVTNVIPVLGHPLAPLDET